MKLRLAATGAVVLASVMTLSASAATAPKTSATQATFFLRMEGCGETAAPGRLEPKKGTDGATGCGTIGGLPIDEVVYQLGEGFASQFDTGKAGLPIKLSGKGTVTGQIAAESWFGAGGVGTVDFDLALTATTSTGKKIDFGSTSVSASASPSENVVMVPFKFAVPAGNDKASLTKITLTVVMHGMNFGMSGQHYDGDSYLVMPTVKK